MSGWVHKTSWLSCHPTATGKWGPAFFEIGCETPLSHSLTSKEYCLKIVHPELLAAHSWTGDRPLWDALRPDPLWLGVLRPSGRGGPRGVWRRPPARLV